MSDQKKPEKASRRLKIEGRFEDALKAALTVAPPLKRDEAQEAQEAQEATKDD